MLQIIRDRLTGWVAIFFIVAIGLTLVVSFSGGDAGVAAGGYAAKVNGEEIPLVEYRRLYQRQLAEQQEIHQGIVPEVIKAQIQRDTLERLVQRKVVTQYVRDNGYRVSTDRLIAAIQSADAFQVAGQFSSQSYQAVLASQGLTPTGFERDQQQAMSVGQLQDGILASSFYTPTEFRRFILLEGEERAVKYVTFTAAALAENLDVSDEAIQAYYDANPGLFMTEENVALEYIELSLADFSKDIEVSESDLRAYYEADPERYRTEEERLARHILITVGPDGDEQAAREKAVAIRARLLGGEDFAAVAKEVSDDPGSAAEGGSLGWARKGDFVTAFEEALFQLEPGQISNVVRSEFGFHIIRLDDIRPGSVKSFEEARDELAVELKETLAEDEYFAAAEKLDDLALENPDSLTPVAQDLGVELKRIDRFTRSGAVPFGYNQLLVDTVFSESVLDHRENSPLIELDDGHAVVVRVTDYRPSVERPLETVKEEIRGGLLIQQAMELADERARAFKQRVVDGEPFEAVAAEYGLEVQSPGLQSRRSDKLPAELLAAVFRAPKPVDGSPVIRGQQMANGDYAVFRLDKVVPGKPESIPRDIRDQRKKILAQQTGAAEATAIAIDLRRQAKVIVAPGLFDEPEVL